MSDDFLCELREEPNPGFAGRLRARLDEIEREDELRRAARPFRRFLPLLVTGVLLAALAFAFLLPPVRAAARQFLDLFRVQRFAAVPVDPQRLARLADSGLDLKTLVGEQVEVLVPPAEPETVPDPESAALAAGLGLRQPTVVPGGRTLEEVRVLRAGSFRIRVDTAKIEALVQALGLEDVEVPAHWNGALVHVDAPPAVALRYGEGGSAFVLVQSRSPEIELPEGLELPQLGRIALRLAGLDADEAELFARRIDWRSTLLVPLPADGTDFHEVELGGRPGLLVSSHVRRDVVGQSGRRRGWHSVLLWSEADRVFALHGPGDGVQLLEMAQSIR